MSKEFVIPPLQAGDRIEDWTLLFQAAVTPLLAKDGDEKLAKGLLPGYINRGPAEKELVVKAIKKTTLAEAFELLCTLDDPVDPYLANWTIPEISTHPLWMTQNWVFKNFRISKKDNCSFCRIPEPADSKS